MNDYYDVVGVGALFVYFLIPLIFALAGYVLTAWFLMKIFEKAGVQGKWRAWVPLYNTLIFAKLGDLSPWWLLILWGGGIVLGWIPFIGQLILLAAFVYLVLAAWRVGLKLQKEPVWLILYVFLAIVWLGINAFDKSRWNPVVAPAPWANSFLVDKTVWSGVPVQPAAPAAPAAPAPGAYPPPAGYQQPPAPPAGYTPPPAPPAAGAPTTPPAPPAAPQPPAAPEPPATEPPATEPPSAQPPADGDQPKA